MPLANVVEDLRSLGRFYQARSYCYIATARNCLHRNYYYQIEKDINSIARRKSNTNVGFVNLFERQDDTWVNAKLRIVNLILEQILIGCGTSHVVLLKLLLLRG
jgi:hypothetical protein